MRLYIVYGDEFAEHVIGNLCNLSTFCKACGLACTYCRLSYGSFARDIHGISKMPPDLPPFIEEPEKHLPKNPPNCDIIFAIGLHHDVLSVMPILAKRAKAKAVVVPIENRQWCPAGIRKQLEDELCAAGVECTFPKPFCSLEETGKPVIDAFIHHHKIGKPLIEVDVAGEVISDAHVLRSAPCGSTWYVTQQIRGAKISKIEDVVAVAHHSYPCTANMEIDAEIGEPILHKAGYNIRDAVKNAIKRALEKE